MATPTSQPVFGNPISRSAFGLGTSASSADANSNNAIGSTTSSLFGSWQPSKSPIFGSSSTFNSSSSSIGSSVAASTASVAATTSPSTGFSFPVSSTTSVPTTTSPFAAFTSSIAASTTSSTGFPFAASGASPSTGFPFAASTASAAAPSSAPVAFGSSIVASSGPTFSFTLAMATPTSQPVFGNPNPFTINPSSSGNNDQMNMEDSMEVDTIQASMPTVPVFGQAPVTPQNQSPFQASNSLGGSSFSLGAGRSDMANRKIVRVSRNPQRGFVFGSTPSAGNPFQFGAPQNSATPQNQSPFQASNSLGGSSFSLGAGGGDKANRKIVRVSRNKTRRK